VPAGPWERLHGRLEELRAWLLTGHAQREHDYAHMGSSGDSGRSSPKSLADALFTKTQQRVLGVLFGEPDRSFYASELIRTAGTGSGAA
jgi:hypothetical protein